MRRLGAADAPAWRELRLRGLREHPEAFTSSYEEDCEQPVAQAEQRLEGGAQYLVGARLSLADLALATAAAPVVMPEKDGSAAPSYDELPAEMRAVVDGFRAHPAGQFVQRIYRDWRLPSPV